jgi:hypothetical protein
MALLGDKDRKIKYWQVEPPRISRAVFFWRVSTLHRNNQEIRRNNLCLAESNIYFIALKYSFTTVILPGQMCSVHLYHKHKRERAFMVS